eukprot:TRINITY_DN27427_c0_g1_i1.p1 TRINITY_DN27427_c0_g1~~TRINITY_DN27427_c0_g1_i1.p1  ORF type:complete len:375 (+),score=48.16 TRINITY_DN27427_c0_g1_i1:57-1127(+)
MIRLFTVRCVGTKVRTALRYDQLRYHVNMRSMAEPKLYKALENAITVQDDADRRQSWDAFAQLWESGVDTGEIEPSFKPLLDEFKASHKYAVTDTKHLRAFMDKMAAAEKYEVTSTELMSLAQYCTNEDQLFEIYAEAVSLVLKCSSIGVTFTQQAILRQITADALLAVRYLALINVESNLRFIKHLKSVGVSPEPRHWTISIKNESRNVEVLGATTDGLNELWSEMRRFNTTPNNVVFTAYISGCCKMSKGLVSDVERSTQFHDEAQQKFNEAILKCNGDLTVAATLLLKLKLYLYASHHIDDEEFEAEDAKEFILNCKGYRRSVKIDMQALTSIYKTRKFFFRKSRVNTFGKKK